MAHLKKLEHCGSKMIFVTYEKGTKAYRAYDLITKKLHITCDVVFDEEDQWDRSIEDHNAEVAGEDIFIMEYISQASLVDEGTIETRRAASPVVAASPQPILGDGSPGNFVEMADSDIMMRRHHRGNVQ